MAEARKQMHGLTLGGNGTPLQAIQLKRRDAEARSKHASRRLNLPYGQNIG